MPQIAPIPAFPRMQGKESNCRAIRSAIYVSQYKACFRNAITSLLNTSGASRMVK